ncbi:carbohydrate ABC transporter permease [Phytoactinopolyspora endophytica]|uniref:carbohydrate ABC transporter permease n=1 Tax=Phytoactinopolyspora endophytica TaxID=1642495 RepID=UPI00101CA9E5|nr:carbohydrate ABC transporter permease [Phytoactinopolyspora endophytica]
MTPEKKAQVGMAERPEVQMSEPPRGGDGAWPATLHPDGRRRRLNGGPKKVIATALVTLVAILFIIPFYWLVISALRPSERIFADAGNFLPSAVTLDNFQNLFDQTPIVTWFMNSVILATGSTVGSMIVVTMAAYALAKIKFPLRNTIFVGILASQMLPFHLLLIPLFLLMIDLSLIDTHLGVIVPMLAHPFGLFYMRQYMLGLPQEMFDAARVDGASEYRIFFGVVVPMVKPAMATLAIIFSLEQWNDLLWPLIVMRSEENFPLSVGITTLVGLYRPRWDLVMTAAVLAVVPIMILFFLLRKQFINGLGQFGTGAK